MITVLQVLPALESGGVEKGTLEVAEALVKAGYRSMVMSAGGRMVDQLIDQGSEHFQWAIGKKSLASFRLVKQLRRFLLDQKVDIIHVRSRLPAWIVYLAWRKMDKLKRPRLVTTVHGFNSVSWYSRIMTRGEIVIAVSHAVKQFVLANYPQTDGSIIRVIHRGIDPEVYPTGYQPDEQWKTQWFKDYPQTLGKKIITLPGRVTRLKGHEDFIEVIQQLVKSGRTVAGVIAGGASAKKQEYLEEIQQLVVKKNLQECIVFTGHRSDLREVLALSDVVLSLTTQPESFGRTTLEALSMDVPVCGYSHGGVKEQLDVLLPDGLVPVRDVSAVASKIDQWIDNPPQIANEKPFTLKLMLDKTLAVYNELQSRS